MRGKGVPIVIKRLTNGITPAYAGKSPHARGQTCHGQDHPRLCGEKESRLTELKKYPGSPPPMRGKVTTVSEKDFSKRITPAYAGKSVQCTHHQAMGWDHPRLCGEKCGVKVLSATERRITPAYAGKRTEGSFSYETSRDHPRLCGEKFDQMCFAGRDPGSPPPMRGKVTVNPDGSVTHGITPAYAGKSPVCGCRRSIRQDHPRLCGEKAICS